MFYVNFTFCYVCFFSKFLMFCWQKSCFCWLGWRIQTYVDNCTNNATKCSAVATKLLEVSSHYRPLLKKSLCFLMTIFLIQNLWPQIINIFLVVNCVLINIDWLSDIVFAPWVHEWCENVRRVVLRCDDTR